MREIYLDNSATTKVCPRAAEKAMSLMITMYGNPSSLHAKGFEAEQEIVKARTIIAQSLGAKPQELIFTSGGTEANNLAIFGAVAAKKRYGNHIVTTMIEHASVLACMKSLEQDGFCVTYLKPNEDGIITEKQLEEAVTEDTILVSMMHVNNETGAILPIEKVSKAIEKAKSKALFHVDAVQSFGKLEVKPKKHRIDLLTLSGHKIHAPKGVGALYVADGVRILPRALGGGQERGLRSGTESTPLIAAFGEAVLCLPQAKEYEQYMRELNKYLKESLQKMPGVMLNSPQDALPSIVNFSVRKVKSETMLHFLSNKRIYVSSGSACAKGEQSHVLVSMGLPKEQIETSIRTSFSFETSKEDIDALLSGIREGLETLRTSNR